MLLQQDKLWKWNMNPPTIQISQGNIRPPSPKLSILTLSGCEQALRNPLSKSNFHVDNNTIVHESQEPLLDTLGLTPAMGIQENENIDLDEMPFCSFPNVNEQISQENMSQDLMNPVNDDSIIAMEDIQAPNEANNMTFNLKSTLVIHNNHQQDGIIPDSLKENKASENRTKVLFKRMGHPVLVDLPYCTITKELTTGSTNASSRNITQIASKVVETDLKTSTTEKPSNIIVDVDENPDIVRDSEEECDNQKVLSDECHDTPIKVSKQKRKIIESPLQVDEIQASEPAVLQPERQHDSHKKPDFNECIQAAKSKKKQCLTKGKMPTLDKRAKRTKQKKKIHEESSSTEPEDSQDQDYRPSKSLVTPLKADESLSLQKSSSVQHKYNSPTPRMKQKKVSFHNSKPYTPCWVLHESGIYFPAMFLEETSQGIKVSFSAGIFNHDSIPSGTKIVEALCIQKFDLTTGDHISIIRSDGSFENHKTISSVVHGQYYELEGTSGFVGMSNVALSDLDIQFNLGKELFKNIIICPCLVEEHLDTLKMFTERKGHLVTSLDSNCMYLIADKPSLLDNYLLALALGVPIVSVEWIVKSIEKGLVLDVNAFRLPNGMNPITQQLSGSIYKQGGVFKGLNFKVLGTDTFKRWAQGILEGSGGKCNSARFDYVIQESKFSKDQGNILTRNNIIDCLITQSLINDFNN